MAYRWSAVIRAALMLWWAGLSAACTAPAQRIEESAVNAGFRELQLRGGAFKLAAFVNRKWPPAGGQPLHVYLDGDGTPWRTRTEFASDPTPRNPVMLSLMAVDPAPSMYLGRPCYHGHAQDPGCSPLLWTHRRYGPEVVASLETALKGILTNRKSTSLTLMGHSGGGALAILLAPRLPGVEAVVTLAGNLDIDAWAKFHSYSPLEGSLNPKDVTGGSTVELHYFGANDLNIPPAIFKPIAARRPGAATQVFAGLDHTCCWKKVWPAILKGLEKRHFEIMRARRIEATQHVAPVGDLEEVGPEE